MADRLINIGFRIYIVLAFAFIFVPIITLVVFAFNDARFPSLPWRGVTTKWFDEVLSNPDFTDSLTNSVIVGVVVAVIATLLGGMAGYFLNKWNFRGKGAYTGLAVLPPCTPLIILGLAFLIFLREIPFLSGSLRAVVVSHVVLASAFAMGIVRMRLSEMDPTLEEAAQNLGASQWRTIREVVLPQALPAILAALFIAMAVSWDEFIISWFVSGLETTLPVRIWNELTARVSARINAIGTIVFGVTIVLVIMAQFFLFVVGRRGRRDESDIDEAPAPAMPREQVVGKAP